MSDTRAAAVEAALAQSEGMFRTPRMFEAPVTDALNGSVHWCPRKSLWIGTMTLVALVGGPLYITWGAIALFIGTTAVTVCLGHSLGMHRRLIHRAYDCPLWLERLFVYLGTLVGLAGPFGMIRQHDIRDWAQRKAACHRFLAHRNAIVTDGFWQLHCDLRLDHPPTLELEDHVASDPFYRFLDRTWMWQQLPWALLFYWFGGLPWVIWGVAVRVTASVTGHWLIGYCAHNQGGPSWFSWSRDRTWHVAGAGVQGYNVRGVGLITMGEAWHNNHHAFPASARLGLKPGENDPGWWVLLALRRVGLVSNLKTPDTLPARANLVHVENAEVGATTT
jgi:fatty-acid desaturase